MNWKLKYKIIAFLLKTRTLKQYDELTSHQVAYKAVQLIDNILNAETPPIIALTNEIQKTTMEV